MTKTPNFQNRFLGHVVTYFVTTVFIVSFGNPAFTQVGNIRNLSRASQIRQISSLCESTKGEIIQELQSPLQPNPKTEVSRQINLFRAAVRKAFKREQVDQWEEQLLLDRLQETLRQDETDLELVDAILDILNTDTTAFKRQSFVQLKKTLEKNRPLLWRQNQQLYLDEVEAVFDSLPGLVETYLKSPDAAHADAVSEVLEYLTETRKADELIALVRQIAVRPNFKVLVHSEVVAPLFLKEIEEPVTVNDNILGTRVRGSGQLTGKLSSSFVPSRDSAIIRVTLEGQLNTKTVGANGPVRVHSDNAADVKTVKDIMISNDSIKTTRSSTNAKQSSHITHVDYTRPGPLVQMIAPGQIQNRKPASDTESERLTKMRFNARVDTAVDESVKPFAESFKNMVSGPGMDNELGFQIGRVATTNRELQLEAVVGNKWQLTTRTRPPVIRTGAGLFLQLHESLADNAGACELSGKTLVEEQVMAELQERFPRLFANREAGETSDEPSLTVSFSNHPIRVNFTDNTVKLTVETTAIQRGGNVYPGMTMDFQFRMEPIDGGFQWVAAEPPEVLPLGFEPENDRLTAGETTIRAILKKKLARITETPMVWKESQMETEFGTKTLKPVHLSAKGGWLSIGLDVVE